MLADIPDAVVIAPIHALLATNSITIPDPTTAFLQYGVLGVLVLAFIMGWIVPGPQARSLLEENQRLTALIEGKLLPMSEQYAATLERSAIVMEKATNVLDQLLNNQAQHFTPPTPPQG